MNENDVDVRERLVAVEQSAKSAHHRLDDVEKLLLGELVKAVHGIEAAQNYIGERMEIIRLDVEELKSKPIRRYDAVVNAILIAVVSGVVGFVIAKLIGG